jgi:tetratricopeptide (TPR) repeat protein
MAFDANPNDAEALFVILHCQMRTNIHPIDGLAMAKKCVSLNPTVADFHHLLGCLHGFVEDFISATRCFERALELDPIPDWLYNRASSLRLQSDRNPNTVIKAYEDYIAASEPDSRKVPEAYYCIAQEYQMMNNDKKVEEFLKKATEAESPPVRLSLFGPVNDDFPPKFMLQNSLKKLMERVVESMGSEASRNPTGEKMLAVLQNLGNQVVQNAKVEEVCQNCGRGGEVLRQCSRCKKVKYCNRDCQKENWKDHKKNCKS